MTQYIPQFARGALSQMINDRGTHPGLSLYRFFEPERGGTDSEKGNFKAVNRLARLNPTGADILLNRQKAHLAELDRLGFKTCSWTQVTGARLVCGMGIDTSLENGLLLDRIFGLPYIPGSSLKGMALDMALREAGNFEDTQERRKQKRLNETILSVFGSQGPEPGQVMDAHWQAGRGHVFFLDALPILPKNKSLFSTDILNPHYGDYYQEPEKHVPADYMKPNPNFFLTVNKGISFSFALAARSADIHFKLPDGTGRTVEKDADSLCAMAAKWVRYGLENCGIGAKTRVGYGYFDPPAKDQKGRCGP